MSAGLDQAFSLAAAELGMATAAWLFTDEAQRSGGAEAVNALRDSLGRRWPVLDAICAGREAGALAPEVDPTRLLQHLQGISRVLVVGLETRWLDRLVGALPSTTELGLLQHSELSPDWARVEANFNGRVSLVGLADFQSWAGHRSALLSFVYGGDAAGLFALSAWVRVSGPDVRTQFRELVGWEVLGVPLSIYPRWLVPVTADQFTRLEAGA